LHLICCAVGATYLDAGSGKEVGATLSSGGFSKDFYRPSWQDDAVASYFASAEYKAHTPSEDFYASGRAYPDIAAFGQNVQVVAAGKVEGVSGTSCSAPIFAGVIAQLNHELMSKGEAPMGWINPWIYANPQMFTDVTEGSNPYEKCDGFYASGTFCSSTTVFNTASLRRLSYLLSPVFLCVSYCFLLSLPGILSCLISLTAVSYHFSPVSYLLSLSCLSWCALTCSRLGPRYWLRHPHLSRDVRK
jgi:hypothetical protein